MIKLRTLVQIGSTFGVRHGMLRLGYEVRRGSGLLSQRMRSAEGWQHWGLKSIAPGASAEYLLNVRRKGTIPFFFQNARALSSAIKSIAGSEGERSIVASAENILNGDLPFFGRHTFASGFPPDWFRNPVTGQRVDPERSWTKMCFASPDYGDLKFILEPSRFLFVYPLARAYAITGDERFAEAFWRAVENWAQCNPPMSGPLWICGQESSLRIIAWTFALNAFIHSAATTPARTALLISMIAAHAWRIERTLDYARSQRSNHLISEAVALWTVGTMYPELERARGLRELGSRLMREAIVDQIKPGGLHLQYSFNYQRFVLQLLLCTLQLAKIHDCDLHADIHQRTTAAYDFISEFVDPISGHAPNHGSNDGSNILPLTSCDSGDYRPLLRLGAAVLNRPTTLSAGLWDEAAIWICDASKAGSDNQVPEAPQVYNTGFFRLGSQQSWALVRAGRYSRRPFQADQLHVDLWWRGLNLARDAGTYLYNGDPPWDNGLAGAAVHNTVTLDGRDQMRRVTRFLWADWAQATGRVSPVLKNGIACKDRFEGEHDGYKQLGVTHRRVVQSLGEDGWVVVDDLLGAGVHEATLHWLLADLPVEKTEACPFAAEFRTERDRIRWSIFSSAPGTGEIIRAGKKPKADSGAEVSIRGWESPTYGELVPAISLVYRVKAQLPLRLITVVLTDDQLQLRSDQPQLEVVRQATSLFRVSLLPLSDV